MDNEIKNAFTEVFMNLLTSFSQINPNQFDPEQYSTPENKEIIENHVRSVIKADPSDDILYRTLKEWVTNGKFLSIDDYVNIGMNEHLCHCPYNIMGYHSNFMELCREFMKFFIIEYGDFPQCLDMKMSFQYYQQEKKFALPDELKAYMIKLVSHLRDPLNTGCESKHKPTKDLEKFKSYRFSDLERKKYKLNCLPFEGKLVKNKIIKNIILNYLRKENDENCCLCMEPIKATDKCFNLKCSHFYHSDKSDDCGGLLQWMQSTDECPICRSKIKMAQ
jgi:hypothetical protein